MIISKTDTLKLMSHGKKFASNETLEEIAVKIPTIVPDWDYLMGKFKASETYKMRSYDFSLLLSIFSELSVQYALKAISSKSPERIRCNPIVEGRKTARYLFRYRGHNVFITNHDGKTFYSELDGVVVADTLPAIIEVKAVKAGEGRNTPIRREIKHICAVKSTLLEEYFCQPQCGYILVVFPEVERLQNFGVLKARGGLVSTLYANRKNFQQRLAEQIEKNNLWLPEPVTDLSSLGLKENSRRFTNSLSLPEKF